MRGFRSFIAAIAAAVSVAAVAACSGELTGPEPTAPISFDWGDPEINCYWETDTDYIVCEEEECYWSGSSFHCDNGCNVYPGDPPGYECPDDGEEQCWEEDCDPSGGGGSYPPPPSEEPPPPLGNDEVALKRPDCSSPVDDYDRAWCGGSVPSGDRLQKLNDVLAALTAKGGECANLARVAGALLQRGDIRLFSRDAGYNFSGAAPRGGGETGEHSWIALSNAWTDVYYDLDHAATMDGVRHTLQSVLAHEIDHLLGRGHTDINQHHTPNSATCAP